MALTYGFMGSGRFAARCLEIISSEITPRWVLTNAPKSAGRGLAQRNTPVWEYADANGFTVYTTEKLSADTERIAQIKESCPDVILVIDFGQMIKEPVLSAASLGCINIHPSRLPEFRGSAPIQRALMQGIASTAVSIFRLDEGMDSGPILAQPELEIDSDDNTASLMEKAARLGAETLLRFLRDIPASEWKFTEQKEETASIAPKIDKIAGKIDWKHENAVEIIKKIRGIGEAPGVFCTYRGKRLRIHKAEAAAGSGEAGLIKIVSGFPTVYCRNGAIKLLEVQPEGKKAQRAEEWARGARIEENAALE